MFSNCLHTPFLQGLKHFDEILQEADGIILSRGNLGIDLPPEKVRLLGLLFITHKYSSHISGLVSYVICNTVASLFNIVYMKNILVGFWPFS